MENQTINRLPFWETIARSFKYVFKNKFLLKALLPAIGSLVVLQILLDLPVACSVSKQACQNDWKQNLTLISIVLVSIGIIINYCRAIVCKADVDFMSLKFWKQMGFYIIATIILSVIILAPAFLGIIATVSLFNSIGLPNVASAAAILVPFISCIYFAPLFLVFPAIAVEDKELFSLFKLFSITKGNRNAIFWAQFVIMIPYWLVSTMVSELYVFIGSDNYAVKLTFAFIMLALGMIDACFKGAFFAHIYQFFKFYDKKA